jgi:hypothetical protein
MHQGGQLAQDLLGERFRGSKGLGNITAAAATGAAIGSVVPVIGTGVGAALGAAYGTLRNLTSGYGFGGHDDRKVESSWHPAILDALYQNGIHLRQNVPKNTLDTIAEELGLSSKEAFKRSPGDVEKQDKRWEKEVQSGRMSWADVNEMSLKRRLGRR